MADYITLRDLTACEQDAVLLGCVGGATYHEVSYVLKTDADGNHQIVGRASDWPLIHLKAENAEQAALLIAATRHAEQADQHVVELLARLEAAEQERAALRAELDQAARLPPALAAAATGLVVEPELLPCPDCPKRFATSQALGSHRHRAHGYRAEGADTPTIAPAAPDATTWRCAECGKPGTPSVNEPDRCKSCVRASIRAVTLMPDAPGWRCANKGCSGAFTRSLKNAAYCTECAKAQPLESANGHALEVGAR